MNKLTKLIVTMLAAFGLIIGTVGPAMANTTADFTATWNAGSTANATGIGVAIAGADATGKTLLQEERTTMSANELKRMEKPTKAQILRYGTVAHNQAQAQQILDRQIPAYDKLVSNAKTKVWKLATRLKYADSAKEKRALKKKLKHARSHLRIVEKDASWKYRPLIRFDGCGRNTGRNDHMVVTSFVECVENSKDHKSEIDLGFDPVEREMRVVGVMYTDGSMKDEPCLNFFFFDIPPGTPSEDLFVVVESFAEVVLTLTVGVHVVGDLTIYGVMRRDGEKCDEETRVKHVDDIVQMPPITVRDTDTDAALAFGVHQVQVDAEARAEVQKTVEANIKTNVSESMHLECASSTAPVVSATPSACVDHGQTGYAVINMVNNNTETTPATVTMNGKTTQSVPSVVGNGGSASVTFNGLTPGTTYSGTVTFTKFGTSMPYNVTVAECAPKGTIAIDRMNDLNQSTVDSDGTLHKSQSPDDVDYKVPAGQQTTLSVNCGSCSSVVFVASGKSTMTVTGDGNLHTVQIMYTASTEPGTDTITVTNPTAAAPATTPVFNINKIVAPPK